MKQDVIISIRGTQQQDSDQEFIELVTAGSYYKEKNNYYITYKESELTGLDGTTTTFKVEPDKITLMRFGQISTHLVFEKGRKHVSYYDVGEGSLTVGVSANKVSSALTDEGGDIEIDYAVEIDHAVTGENNFKLNIRRANPLS